MALVELTARGLYCPLGGFYIDPWEPCPLAVITHAHGDHLIAGHGRYVLAREGVSLARRRLPEDSVLDAREYGEEFKLSSVSVSLHPAGHILGSSQVRLQASGQVWVLSGDYKRVADPTCKPFAQLHCDVFVSEATFGLPIYRWEPTARTITDIYDWWRSNRDHQRASVLFAYPLGKSQRILAELKALTSEPVFEHGAVAAMTRLYREAGVELPPTLDATSARQRDYRGALILAPPSALGSVWLRRFGNYSSAFCSGWMRVRGNRRRRSVDRGFVLSDHADWPALLSTCEETGARKILLTHGQSETLTRYLGERGIDAAALPTQFGNEAA